jgi:competence protein ComEC
LLIAAVLAFSAGVYLEALFGAPAGPLLFAAIALALLLPLAGTRRYASVPLLLAAFLLCGAFRLALPQAACVDVPEYETGVALYEGTVTEGSPRIKVISLSSPASLMGVRVVFSSSSSGLEVGREVRLSGRIRPLVPSFENPGALSWKWLKRLEGIGYEVRGTIVASSEGRDPVGRLRRYFKTNIERSGAMQTDVLTALAIGDRTAIPREKNDLFLRTGTSHILAISGFNVGIVSGFFFLLARSCFRRVRRFALSGRDTRYAALATMPFPFLFMLVAGSGVSVIRAAIMVASSCSPCSSKGKRTLTTPRRSPPS